ncbi:hypothetical protein DL96DRAFT_1588058 [Flagelloscypha sp. PMI_526]|nr:hypothetical protein DL96DRAFT_1588058 [Flagelloscypha sp. PMI_526]
MFSCLALISMLAFASVCYSAPASGANSKYTCGSNNELKCCSNENNGGSPIANGIAGLLTGAGQIQVPIAVSCTNVNVLGFLANGSKCQQTIACCDGNNQNGVLNLQCIPAGVQV